MNKQCENTEIFKTKIEHYINVGEMVCNFYSVLGTEFEKICINTSFEEANRCKTSIIYKTYNGFFEDRPEIVDYMLEKRGDIDKILKRLNHIRITTICWLVNNIIKIYMTFSNFSTLLQIQRCAEKVVKNRCDLLQDNDLEEAQTTINDRLNLPYEDFNCIKLQHCNISSKLSLSYIILLLLLISNSY